MATRMQRNAPRDSAQRQDGEATSHRDPVDDARALCLRLLTTAPRSRSELAAELRRRGTPNEVAEQVLARLADVGLIDDQSFAETLVSARQRSRSLGRRAIVAELRRRGVDDDVVQTAVAPIDRETELAAARTLVARRLPMTAGRAAPVRYRRLVAMLVRKGYSTGLAAEVVRESLAGEGTIEGDSGWVEDELTDEAVDDEEDAVTTRRG